MLYLKYEKNSTTKITCENSNFTQMSCSFEKIEFVTKYFDSNNAIKSTFVISKLLPQIDSKNNIRGSHTKSICVSEKELYETTTLTSLECSILDYDAIYVAVGDEYIYHPAFSEPLYFRINFYKDNPEKKHTEEYYTIGMAMNEAKKLRGIGYHVSIESVSIIHESPNFEKCDKYSYITNKESDKQYMNAEK